MKPLESESEVAENEWRRLVLKHTKAGACNFQAAADEIAGLAAAAERERCATQLDALGFGHCATALRNMA